MHAYMHATHLLCSTARARRASVSFVYASSTNADIIDVTDSALSSVRIHSIASVRLASGTSPSAMLRSARTTPAWPEPESGSGSESGSGLGSGLGSGSESGPGLGSGLGSGSESGPGLGSGLGPGSGSGSGSGSGLGVGVGRVHLIRHGRQASYHEVRVIG